MIAVTEVPVPNAVFVDSLLVSSNRVSASLAVASTALAGFGSVSGLSTINICVVVSDDKPSMAPVRTSQSEVILVGLAASVVALSPVSLPACKSIILLLIRD